MSSGAQIDVLVVTRDADFRILVPLPPLPLPHFPSTFIKNVDILLVAIPPTSAEALDPADRFRFRFPGYDS